eukprot:134498_1
MSSLFIKSDQLPMCFNADIPKPSYDPVNKNCIIISTNYKNKQTRGIYKYNMVTNESEIIHKYNGTCEPDRHGQFIDPSNNTLILYGGARETFKIFDLNTNKMKQNNDTNIISKCGIYPRNTFIPPINHVHILTRYCQHYTLDITTKEVKTNSKLESNQIYTYVKLLYIESHKKLFVFGTDENNKIFEHDNNNNKWNINQLEMPYSEDE